MQTLKFIQVNIYKGKYMENLLDFLKDENPDFITMQEVTTKGFNLCSDKEANLFELIKSELKMNGAFNGDLKLAGSRDSFFGNAVFSKYKIIKSNVIVLKTFRPVTIDELDGVSGEIREQIPRHLLDAEVDCFGKIMHILSWHGAWTAPPADTAETLRQAKLVANYLACLDKPFILGGDLNNIMGSKTLGFIENIANNLMRGSDAVQTTHPTVHRIARRGYFIDYIFCSSQFRTKAIRVPQVLVSDHLPVVGELEI